MRNIQVPLIFRFACLNLIALTVFTEMWKRRSNEHAFYFGTYGKLRHKPPRPAFRGKFEKNPITGREEVSTYRYFSVYLNFGAVLHSQQNTNF